jgi:hypothetical protein
MLVQGSHLAKDNLDRRIINAGHHLAMSCPVIAGRGIAVVTPQESTLMVGNLTVFTQVCLGCGV